jgi:hypothetical protein
MSALGIFLVGLFVSTLCLFGIYFTITELSRLGRESDDRARAGRR